MKAGGVKFADTPEEAAEHAEAILELEINGHMPRGVLVDPKAEVKQEYYAGVVWDGTAKRPLMLFSDMGGIDIEEVAETHPDHVGRGHLSNLLPISDFEAKQVDRRDRRHRLAAEPRDADPRPPRPPLPRQRHDPGRDQPAGRARPTAASSPSTPTWRWRTRRSAARRRCCASELEIAEDDTRETYEPSDFERNVAAIDAADHRGVIQGKDHGFDGNLGLVIGAGGGSLTLTDAVRSQGGKPANYSEIGGNPSVAKACGLAKEVLRKGRRREDRGDDVDRLQHPGRHRRPRRDQGLPRAGQGPRRDDRDLPHPRRLGGGGLQDPRALRGRVLRPLGLDVGGGGPRRRKIQGAPAMSILLSKDTPSSSRGSPGARRST